MIVKFITSNRGKAGLANERLSKYSVVVEQLHVALPEIQSLSVVDVVREKARQAYAMTTEPFLIEDSGLYIEALGGFPGALMKPTLETLGDERLASLVGREWNKRAYVESALVFGEASAGTLEVFTGVCRGTIAETPRGVHRRGWVVERVFVPEGYGQALAEMNDAAWQAFLDEVRHGDPYDQCGRWLRGRTRSRSERTE